MAEVLEDKFNYLNFIHFLPDAVLEAVHPFLNRGKEYNNIHEYAIALPSLLLLGPRRLHSNYISI